ncbi:GNAT family N-acetyltransferase [Bacillus canaveralius]|uniref:GNAT family N-acetyltransferase n=1 Tax=Bacillus canaveralius TaxID=1403243 RepID=A0A2N5GQ91_9BACI|nr:GNAT family N-acetyltransferase [Bacillus canaveralius]PLR85045.1 GNAT family N-acetyltransferase [Bacillus canaveralius]PLS00957.1 GNAT family N-acetyltransferase [Bacillus canaveralius]RSK54177.1 GNAT family N-acetyltransferase [Bacillus canaveralius]
MERKSLIMKHDLNFIPSYTLPINYSIRNFELVDLEQWAKILTAANEFESVEKALERFNWEYQPYLEEVKKRVLFIENEQGQVIGTASAWFDKDNIAMGRIHWVAILPGYQGKKLAKPLLSVILQRLSKFHKEAYLKTQTTNNRAINLYLSLGFRSTDQG